MKNLFLLLVIIFALIAGCKQPVDSIVAEAFHKKLYLSEVVEKVPYSSSKEDSLLFMEQYVEEWVLRQTLLAQAKKKLTQKEQNFSSQIAQYKEQLLINAYFQKIGNNHNLFYVSKEELDNFINETKNDETPEYRDMVQLNYIKLSNPSKLYKKIKELFFSDTDRAKSLAEIELLCADTIEYYLDSEHWFYTDLLENELSFSFSNLTKKEEQEKIDIIQNGYRYLILILNKKQQLQTKNVFEDKEIARSLLSQQKLTSYITSYQDSLMKKAIMERKVVRYPMVL